jgi:hypothetical protein
MPRRIPYPLATAVAALEEARAAIFHQPPLLTRGVVDIFRHDWSLESDIARAELGLTMTPLEDGLQRTLASLR